MKDEISTVEDAEAVVLDVATDVMEVVVVGVEMQSVNAATTVET